MYVTEHIKKFVLIILRTKKKIILLCPSSATCASLVREVDARYFKKTSCIMSLQND